MVIPWTSKMLVSDPSREFIYRFDAVAEQERDFTSDGIIEGLNQRRSALGISATLQSLVLIILLATAAGLVGLWSLLSLRGKVYTHPESTSDAGIDIGNDNIRWLEPSPDWQPRLLRLGYGFAALWVLMFILGFVAGLGIWSLVAIVLILGGIGGLFYAMIRANSCHLGVLGEHLILVDHNNTYRVGSGPRIQYFQNYVMVDDVIVYLGNRVASPFASDPLENEFIPLVNTGIKIDRATLRIKLFQTRHPMLLGISGLAATVCLAGLLILLS